MSDNQIRWLLENRIIYNQLRGDISVEMIEWGEGILLDLLDANESKVHIIFDSAEITSAPTQLTQIKRLTERIFAHPHIGYSIVVTENRLMRFLGNLAGQINRASLELVANLDEGLGRLQKLDLALPPLKILTLHPTIRSFAEEKETWHKS